MVFVCCVPGCNNKILGKKSPNLSFHRFPRDICQKKAWIDACGKRNWLPRSDRTVLCSDHFREEDFNRTYASGVVKLREGVVPTIFPTLEKVQHSASHRARLSNKSTTFSHSIKTDVDAIAKIKIEPRNMVEEDPKEMVKQIQEGISGDAKRLSKVGVSHRGSLEGGGGGRIRKKTWKLLEEEQMSEEWNRLHTEKTPLRGRRKTLKRNLDRGNVGEVNKMARHGGESPKKKLKPPQQLSDTPSKSAALMQNGKCEQKDSADNTSDNQMMGLMNHQQPAVAPNIIVSTVQTSPNTQNGKPATDDSGHKATPSIGVIQPTTNLIVPAIQPIQPLTQDGKVQQAGGGGGSDNSGVGVIPTVYPPLFQPLANQLFFLVVPQKPVDSGGGGGEGNNTAGVLTADSMCSTATTSVALNASTAQGEDVRLPVDKTKSQLELTLKLKSLTVELAEARMKKKLLIQSINRIKKRLEKSNTSNGNKKATADDQKSDGQLADTLRQKMLTFELSQQMKTIITLLNTKRQIRAQKKALQCNGVLYSTSMSGTVTVDNGGSECLQNGARVKKKRGRKPGSTNSSKLSPRITPRKILPKLDTFQESAAKYGGEILSGGGNKVSSSDQELGLQQTDNQENISGYQLLAELESDYDDDDDYDYEMNGDRNSDDQVESTMLLRQPTLLDDKSKRSSRTLKENNNKWSCIVGRSSDREDPPLEEEDEDEAEEEEEEEDEEDDFSIGNRSRWMVCPESGCHLRSESYDALRKHIDRSHQPLAQCSTHTFNTYKEFLRWKTNMEKCREVSFGLNCSMKKDESGSRGLCVFVCQDATSGDCPATVEVTLTISDQATITSVHAIHYPTHYGHTLPHHQQEDDKVKNEQEEVTQSDTVATLHDGTEEGENRDEDPEEVDDVDTELEIYAEQEADNSILQEMNTVDDIKEPNGEELAVGCRVTKIDNAIIYSGKGGGGGVRPAVTTDPIKEKILLTLRTAEEMVIKTSQLTEQRGLLIVDTLLQVLDQLTDSYTTPAAIDNPHKSALDHSYCE